MENNNRDIRYEEEYKSLRRTRRKLKRENAKLRKFNLVLSGIIVILLGVIFFGGTSMIASNKVLKAQLDETKEKLAAADDANIQILENFNSVSENLEKTSQIATTLDDQNKELVDKVNELNDTLNAYEAREELFDKYEYALIRENGTRTDITYEEIDNLKKTAKELNMTDESIDLILSLVMTETRGDEDAINKESTAKGLGQILNDTGKFVWVKLMNNSGYSHSEVALNGNNNLQMMAYYLNYLDDKYNGNTKSVVKEYRGENDTEYFKMVNKYLGNNNLDLGKLKINER